jgi:hypothetical protein
MLVRCPGGYPASPPLRPPALVVTWKSCAPSQRLWRFSCHLAATEIETQRLSYQREGRGARGTGNPEFSSVRLDDSHSLLVGMDEYHRTTTGWGGLGEVTDNFNSHSSNRTTFIICSFGRMSTTHMEGRADGWGDGNRMSSSPYSSMSVSTTHPVYSVTSPPSLIFT